MSLFSDLLSVTGAAAGILLLLVLTLSPLLTEMPSPRRRSLPADASGSLPVTESEPVEPVLPAQSGGVRVAVRHKEIVLPVQRAAVTVTIPGQRGATLYS